MVLFGWLAGCCFVCLLALVECFIQAAVFLLKV